MWGKGLQPSPMLSPNPHTKFFFVNEPQRDSDSDYFVVWIENAQGDCGSGFLPQELREMEKHCGGKVKCRRGDPPQAENPAKQDSHLFHCYRFCQIAGFIYVKSF